MCPEIAKNYVRNLTARRISFAPTDTEAPILHACVEDGKEFKIGHPTSILACTPLSLLCPDVYAFGIVMAAMVMKGDPYPNIDDSTDLIEKTATGFRPDLPPRTCPRFAEFMQNCWKESPEERPSFCKLMSQLKAYCRHLDQMTQQQHGEAE
jgi:hypothetical protein